MKFSCDRCQTRYSIGDDKVRGKVLKIRCKTCENIIVVREETAAVQSAAAAAGGGGSTAPGPAASGATAPAGGARGAAPPATGTVAWYVAIKGKQHGPASQADIERLFREGQITERTHLWNEGMAAWTRLQDLPTFAHLRGTGPAPRRAPPPPPPDEAQQPQAARGAEIIPFDEARRAREAQAAPPATLDPFAAVSGPNAAPSDSAPRDSTRVFIMKAGLANRSAKHRTYAAVATLAILALVGACVLDYQGIIEIPGLHSVVVAVSKTEGFTQTASADWSDVEEDPELKCKLMPNYEKCVRETIIANAAKRMERRPKKTAPDGSPLSGLNLDDAFGGSGAPSGGIQRSPAGASAGPLAELTDKERAILASFKKAGPSGPTLRPVDQLPAMDTGSVDAATVAKVFKDNTAAIADCVEKASKTSSLPSGKQKLMLSLENDGKVSAARFQNGAVNASPIGECVTKAVKKFRFPPFVGPPADVEMPLLLSAN